MRQFPTEILYHILGTLRGHESDIDYHTLRQSLQVSRDWFPIARRFLFHHVSVSQGHSRRNVASFAEFLHAKPGLKRAVKSLRVSFYQTGLSALSVDELSKILALLPCLHHLDLSGDALPSLPSDHSAQWSIPSLRLSILGGTWSPLGVQGLSQTLQFLLYFTNVGELCLSLPMDLYLDDFDNTLAHFPDLSGLKVTSFLLKHAIHSRLLEICRHTHLLDTLSKLTLVIDTVATITLLSEVLSAKQCILQELTLTFNSKKLFENRELAPQTAQESITTCLQPALRALHTLRTFDLRSSVTSWGSFFWETTCPGLLASLPLAIAIVHLYVNTSGFPIIKLRPSRPRCRVFPLEMPELDAALGRYEKLTDVYVHVTRLEELTRELPATLAGGKRVHCTPWLYGSGFY